MEYQLFPEPMPDYQPGWFQRAHWSNEPVSEAGAYVLLAAVLLSLGWLALAVAVGFIGLFVDLSWGVVMSVIWTILLIIAALLLIAAAGLLIYRFMVLPRLQQENREQYLRAIDEWRQRRAAHIAEWERRLGWTD